MKSSISRKEFSEQKLKNLQVPLNKNLPKTGDENEVTDFPNGKALTFFRIYILGEVAYFMPLHLFILSPYGCAFCWCIIFVFEEDKMAFHLF